MIHRGVETMCRKIAIPDKSRPPSARAEELLAQMTVQEKTGQLCQRLYGFRVYETGSNGEITCTEEFAKEVEACGGLGTLYGLYRADPWSKRGYENGLCKEQAVSVYNMLQKYVLEHARIPIPMLMSSECPHGHQALDGYILPVNLAAGASFSPKLLREAAEVCGRQLRGMGVDLALVSALDILRDPRWGRSEECFGEDPYLAGCMASAVVEGIQKQGVGVVAKHFCAQGETTGGVNASAARIGERELQEIHLPAARACCAAGVKGIMAAYNEIDGIYCHANEHLLNKILREDFGFDGVVMADGVAIDQLDVMTGDNVVSAATALKAGVDIGLWDQAFSKLAEALERGLISMEEIDRAVLRVLELKFELGLFDMPYIGPDGTRTAEYPNGGYYEAFPYEKYPQSKRLAEESVVLLQNNGRLLPLQSAGQKIAVIGPNADDIYRQIGDYSPPLRDGVGSTIWNGLLAAAGERTLRLSTGENLQEATELALWSDVVICVLGGSSSRFWGAVFDKNGAAIKSETMQMDCGEGVDSAHIALPGKQEELFRTIAECGKKMVTIVIAGRPYAIPSIKEKTDALLYAFYPGPMGGEAIAELIYGKKSPSGRLPVSLPRSVGQLPVYYNYRKSYQAMRYYEEADGALYAFGDGFGYSCFECRDVKVHTDVREILLCCTVENTGEWEDAIVLQCYRRLGASEVVPRVRELVAFEKVWLMPGECREVRIAIDRKSLSVYGLDGKWKETKNPQELLMMDGGVLLWKGTVKCT